MNEMLIKGGTVIDGTGAPRFQGDVLLSDGKITAIGESLNGPARVIDATGLIVAPGIVDPHTHLDGQLFFERRGSSSSWHGVTTVMTGLCGYSLAPCKPEDREYLIRMFARVEEMPLELFRTELPWSWVSFGEYIDALDAGLGLNVVTMVGHSTLRYNTMGAESLERAATENEINAMRAALRESMDAGAFGFTTSLAPSHFDMDLKPVPSRQATPDEMVGLAEELRDRPSTHMALIPSGLFRGMTDEDKELILRMTSVADSPMQLNGFGAGADAWDFMGLATAAGATLWGVVSAQPFYKYVTLYDGTTHFNSMDTWTSILDKPSEERKELFASPDLRQKLRDEVDLEPAIDAMVLRRPRINWDLVTIHKAHHEKNRGLEGVSIAELAKRQGKHLADALLDLAVSEDLKTVLCTRLEPEAKFFDQSKARVYRNPFSVPMNSDAGAHLQAECKAGEGTYFLRRWVLDHAIMSLEEGLRKVTSMPAKLLGLTDRGAIRVGAKADIMLFDPSKLNALDKETRNDFPGGATRWIQKAEGVEYVLVNGQPTIWQGEEVGDLPGKVLRSTSYR